MDTKYERHVFWHASIGRSSPDYRLLAPYPDPLWYSADACLHKSRLYALKRSSKMEAHRSPVLAGRGATLVLLVLLISQGSLSPSTAGWLNACTAASLQHHRFAHVPSFPCTPANTHAPSPCWPEHMHFGILILVNFCAFLPRALLQVFSPHRVERMQVF